MMAMSKVAAGDAEDSTVPPQSRSAKPKARFSVSKRL
jgi:hypothetical protein